jgi:hypothetical protein
MVSIFVRDDDANATTDPKLLETTYAPLFDAGVAVHFSVIPRVALDLLNPQRVREHFLDPRTASTPGGVGTLTPDTPLAVWLRRNSNHAGVLMHGLSHERIRGRGEFGALDEREARERVGTGRAILAHALGAAPRGFVPPFELLSPAALRVIIDEFDFVSLREVALRALPPLAWPTHVGERWSERETLDVRRCRILRHRDPPLHGRTPPSDVGPIVARLVRRANVAVIPLHHWSFWWAGRSEPRVDIEPRARGPHPVVVALARAIREYPTVATDGLIAPPSHSRSGAPARARTAAPASAPSDAPAILAVSDSDPTVTALFAALARLRPVRIVAENSVFVRPRPTPVPCVIVTSPRSHALVDALPESRLLYYARDDFGQLPWERAIVARSSHVVAVSSALAHALMQRYGISRDHVTVSPNAVPEAWIPPSLPERPGARPGPPRRPPIAGVLGKISSRLRLGWLRRAVRELPAMHWLFVGGIETHSVSLADWPSLLWLRTHPRCSFVGHVPYDSLKDHAAAIDVGVLPYSTRGINPLGSPTRFFSHLPFGTPLVATPGCLQLDEFASLVTICASEAALVRELDALARAGFDDGRREQRWREARRHTWELRAQALSAIVDALVPDPARGRLP